MVSRKTAAVALLLVALAATHASPLRTPARAPLSGAWREAADLRRVFTPQSVPEGTYRAYVSDLGFDAAVKQVTSDPAMSVWPDAWKVERLAPADAFGQGAGYNRWTVARLYGAATARVARGPRMESGQPVETWTLISPYPNAAIDRLERGTLLIVLKLR
jgi:hypothetical protein